MGKVFLNLTEQIVYLKENKNLEIDVSNKKVSTFLLKNNYYNFINSIKIFYTTGRDDNNSHCYDTSEISKWMTCFENNKVLELELFQKILAIENIINSMLSYFIGLKFINNELTDEFIIIYKECLKRCKNNKGANIRFEQNMLAQSFIYVPKMSFGSSIRLLAKLDNQEKSRILRMISFKQEELIELVILRNGIGHNTPLSILLTCEQEFNRRKRIELVEKLGFDLNYIKKIKYYNENCR